VAFQQISQPRPAGTYNFTAFYAITTNNVGDGNQASCVVVLQVGNQNLIVTPSIPALTTVQYQQLSAIIPASQTSNTIDVIYTCTESVSADIVGVYLDDVSIELVS
jgi:hypothetical protein